MENEEISLEEFIGHGLILKEQIDQDMIDLKQFGDEISVLTTKMNDLHTSLSQKIKTKEEYDQTLFDCKYKWYRSVYFEMSFCYLEISQKTSKNSTLLFWYLKLDCFRSFFGRIEDTRKTFRNQLTF